MEHCANEISETELEGKVKTHTNHSAYQEPILRTDIHNLIRSVFGKLSMIVSLAVFIFSVIGFIYLISTFVMTAFSGFNDRFEIIQDIALI